MQKKFVLFDFDGVIADTFAVAFETKKVICPHTNEEEYRRQFDGNIHEWKDGALGHGTDCRLDIDFSHEYVPRMRKQARIFDGMANVITQLEKNYTLCVISSTISSPVEDFLMMHNLASHFAWTMGSDIHKSKVEKIKMVFAKYGVVANDCVFVTDTLGDMREAAQSGVGAIGVLWGFQETETLSKGNPFRLIESPSALNTAIADYFSNK